MEWRRIGLWAGVIAAVLVAVAAIALHALVDPERLRKAAADRALAAWERELLMGDVRLDLLPVPALRASKVSFANPRWAREPHLLQADTVRADLELLPLLTGKIRIKRLSLDGVRAGLEIADDGAASWELREAPKKPSASGESQGAELEIATIELRNARVSLRRGAERGEPWLIEDATVDSAPGQKDVTLEATVSHHDRPLKVKARFDDLSRLGQAGATSEGRIDLELGQARLEATGRFPLGKGLRGLAVDARLEARSMQDVYAFFAIDRGKTAPVAVKLTAREREGRVVMSPLEATLGELAVRGEVDLDVDSPRKLHARLEAGRIDWLKTLVDAGGKVKPPRHDQEVFHPDPVAWRIVTSLGALEGTAELAVKSLKLGNGIEVRNARTKVAFGDGRLAMAPFSGEMLGGSARGSLRFDGRAKTVRFELDGENLLLERWLHERGREIPFRGGPMRIKARLSLAGATYRELAASVTGPLSIRMGKAVWASKGAGAAEERMVNVFADGDGKDVAFECAAAELHFKSGRASGRNLVAARTDVSQLLTSGHVDAREETVDLRGRLVPRKGARIGLATLAGEVQVTGRFAKPGMRLDPSAKPAVIARAGAAIASAGATLIGSALLDAAAAQEDPCGRV